MFTNLFLKMLNHEASLPKRRARDIVEKLNLSEGDAVADIGSGGGYFTLAFAQIVGKQGTVFAVDNNHKNLIFVGNQAQAAGLDNINFVAGENNEVSLPEASLDVVFARNVFHHLGDPVGFFRLIKNALKPGGKVAIIDHLPGGGLSYVNVFKHFTPKAAIENAMASAGYRLVESHDLLEGQSFTIWSSTST